MGTTRRRFLQQAAVAGGATATGLASANAAWAVSDRAGKEGPASVRDEPKQGNPLRILVLGGTGFIGPHIVQRAVDRGHEVTLFNRGRTNTHLFPDLENLIGDRENDLESLKGRSWDLVIDNARDNPMWVRDSATLLKDAVERYLFTSTRSVYSDFSRVGMTALDAPLQEVDPEAVDRGDRLSYGPSKVLCELETRKVFADRSLIVRPGLIVGPGDTTDRFTYWPWRIDRGGEVLAPGDGSDPCMFIDVRDLGIWYVRLAEEGTTGIYNALSPKGGLRFDHLLYGIKATTTTDVDFTWVDADFCAEHRIRGYAEMPLWYPAVGQRAGFARFDLSREIEAGLAWRPLAETAGDTLAWHKTRPPERRDSLTGSALKPDREKEVLTAWHARSG